MTLPFGPRDRISDQVVSFAVPSAAGGPTIGSGPAAALRRVSVPPLPSLARATVEELRTHLAALRLSRAASFGVLCGFGASAEVLDMAVQEDDLLVLRIQAVESQLASR